MNIEYLLHEALQLPNTHRAHINALKYILHREVSVDLKFLAAQSLTEIHNQYNLWVTEKGLDESCTVGPNDSASTVRKKCKKAFKHGEKVYPMHWIYAVADSPVASGLGEEFNAYDSPDYALNGFTGSLKKKEDPADKETLTRRFADIDPIEEEKSSTERVRKYYKRHPEKVRKYLKDTVKDRVARNRDRAKAVKKHGKEKMKNHDVHHPNGPQNGGARLVKKDHGRDKVNEEYSPDVISSTIQEFVNFAVQKLRLQTLPTVAIIPSSEEMTSLGYYDPMTKQINVVVEGRLLADILRTLAHELAHRKQDELGLITNPVVDGATGSPIENNANAIAGILLRQYGQINQRIFMTEGLLMEGGAAGHLAHPFEDEDLTFKDMKEMINRGLVGGLDQEAPVTEKLDGQNIAFTVRDGQIVFARNKSHVKAKGKNALDVAGIRNMFAGRGNIEKAFTGAAQDLQAAVQKLSPEEVQQMFGGGSKFMSLEVILPDTQNVIPYGKSVLVMHGTIEYDEEGNEIGRSNTDGKEFADAVTAVGADQQQTFGISGPKTIAFSDLESERYQERAQEYSDVLDRAAQSFGLDDTSTLAEYRRMWWEQEIQKEMERTGLNLSEDEFNGLISRWADGDKKFGVKNIEDDETKKWFRDYEKNSLQTAQKKMIRPIENVFLQAGADSLRRVTNFLSANNPEATTQLKNDVLTAIKAIRDSNQPDKIAKLQKELERLEAIGMDKVVPSEGVVFIYNGKPYKFTGTFAPINQITGTFKFGMAPKEVEEPAEPSKEVPITEPKSDETPTEPQEPTPTEPVTPKRTVAIFTGRFQPFHSGHYSIYQGLVDKFGKENVYIASSNVTDPIKSPFEFNDKKKIMTTMFDIPEDMVVQVKNPYAPKEILDKLPPETTYVTAVSQKDATRLGGKYFRNYDDVPDGKHRGFKDQGYFIVAPEMQLSIDGKNISGTQLRAVMGDPNITDRAKQEIFTKVYGKFDPKIFKKIVTTTTASEEARKLTDMHGTEENPKVDTKPTTPEKKKPDDRTVGRARSVLGQKVRNPKTNKDILVATALKYAEDEPVRKAAERIVQQAMVQKEVVLTEGKTPKKLKVYTNIREYTSEDLDNEVDEYFKNERTLDAFPDMADSATELKKLISNAPSEVLEVDELNALENSDVSDVLKGTNKMQVLKKLLGKKQDVKGLLHDIKNDKPIAMPIVIKHTNGYYLLGGNTRLSVLAAIGHTMPVKVLGQASPYPSPYVQGSAETPSKGKQKKTGNKDLFKKLMQMRITNPETGNQVKVDTAMDYDKLHPAHKAAMAFIRQHMKGISNRAGIPKNRND